MEFGISMFGDISANSTPGKRLNEIIEEIKLIDESGLDFFGIGEHHRPDYAVSVPEIILAAAATVTKKIKLGSAVTVLSSSDPVRVYQSFATIDLISGGRAEMNVGRGSFTESFPLFGYSLSDYDELFEEKLQLLLKINNEKKINWKGNFRAELKEQEIHPRAEKPIDIWIAVGGTPESVLRAARLGLPVVFAIIGGNPIHFVQLFDYYRKLYEHFGHDKTALRIGVHMHTFLGDDGKKTADEYYQSYASQMNRIGKERGWPPYQKDQYDFGRSRQGHLVIGDINEAAEKITMLKEMFGLTRFSAHMDVGGPDHSSMMKSIELFSRVKEKVS